MGWLSDFQSNLKGRLDRFNNATFKDGAMATVALIAAADGNVSSEERAKVIKLIAGMEALQAFNAADLGVQFTGYCDKAKDEFARLDLLKLVGKLKGKEEADIAVKVAIILANADGNFDDNEKKVVREICSSLGLKADEYLAV